MTDTSRIEQRRYLQSMLRELHDMAAGNRDPLVAYFLQMAYIEVSDLLRSSHDAEQRQEAA